MMWIRQTFWGCRNNYGLTYFGHGSRTGIERFTMSLEPLVWERTTEHHPNGCITASAKPFAYMSAVDWGYRLASRYTDPSQVHHATTTYSPQKGLIAHRVAGELRSTQPSVTTAGPNLWYSTPCHREVLPVGPRKTAQPSVTTAGPNLWYSTPCHREVLPVGPRKTAQPTGREPVSYTSKHWPKSLSHWLLTALRRLFNA